MNNKTGVIMTFFVAALFFLATPAFAAVMEGNTTGFNHDLAKVTKGSIVYNDQGQMLGTVNRLVLGDDGRISYIILAQDSIHWSGLTAYYSTPAWVDSGIRLIPIPYDEVRVRHLPDRAAQEFAQGEPFWGTRPVAFESPAMATDHGYWAYTPESVAAVPDGKIFWGLVPPAFLSPANPELGVSRTYLNRHVEVNITEEELANAPSFAPNEWAKFANSQQFKNSVHAYYEQQRPGQMYPENEMMEAPADQSDIY